MRIGIDPPTPTLTDLFHSQQSGSSPGELRPLILRRWREESGGRRILFLHFIGEEQELEKRNSVMYKRFIMLLGIFLGSFAPAAAQTPAPQIVLAQEHFAPAITMIRTVSTPSPTASFLPYRDPGISPLISVACSRELMNVTTAWSAFPRWKRVRLFFSRSRTCRSSNSGADGYNWTPFSTRFTFRTCRWVL